MIFRGSGAAHCHELGKDCRDGAGGGFGRAVGWIDFAKGSEGGGFKGLAEFVTFLLADRDDIRGVWILDRADGRLYWDWIQTGWFI
jgi:hypothetical protein